MITCDGNYRDELDSPAHRLCTYEGCFVEYRSVENG
jgi:hypothetical protein